MSNPVSIEVVAFEVLALYPPAKEQAPLDDEHADEGGDGSQGRERAEAGPAAGPAA